MTDDLIGDLSDISTSQNTNEDMQRIQELLSSPANEAVAQEASHQ